jgi:hypothetical protein
MKKEFKNITILNSANMPSDGIYNKKTISKNQFIELIQDAEVIHSSVGYESVAELIKELTGVAVDVNRDLTFINNGSSIVGCTLGYRLNPKNKGFTEPNEDDYIYFIAEYSSNDDI